MSELSGLLALAGDWAGTKRLWLTPDEPVRESDTTAKVVPVLGGLFVRIDYTWRIDDTPQEGSLLLGFDSKAAEVKACWIDSWHMGELAMVCRGAASAARAVDVLGTYAAPPGPDWGWRIVVDNGPALVLRMFNITPDGKEALAVEATYSRSP